MLSTERIFHWPCNFAKRFFTSSSGIGVEPFGMPLTRGALQARQQSTAKVLLSRDSEQ